MRAARVLLPFSLALVASGTFWLAPFIHWEATGFGDWQLFHMMWESARVSIVDFGELPFGNPHQCGGSSHWGNPQNQAFSPLWWLTGLPFGTTVGHKLYLVVHCALGLSGTFCFCRRFVGLSPIASVFAACVWSFCGTLVWDGAGGHATFLSFYFTPWLLYAWRRAHRDLRWCSVVAGILGLTMSEAATYPPPYFLILLAFDTGTGLLRGVPWQRLLRTGLISGFLALLVSAFRLVPVLMTVLTYPRPKEAIDHLTLVELFTSWTLREHPWLTPGHPYVWAEYGAFVGWTVVALAAIGLLLAARRRRYLDLSLGVILFAWYAMGATEDWFPWSLTHMLPVYSSLRVPSRFLVFATFYLALLGGLALDQLVRSGRLLPRWRLRVTVWRALPIVIVLVAVTDIAVANVPVTDRWRGPVLPRSHETAVVDAEFHLVRPGNLFKEYASYPQRRLGTILCHEEVPWPVSPLLWLGDVPQVRLASGSHGLVLAARRTPQRFFATVDLEEPGTVHFNQNFGPEWVANVGTVLNDRKLLALDLPAGRHEVKLWMRPPDLPWSACASALGVVLCFFTWFFGRRRPLRASLRRAGGQRP